MRENINENKTKPLPFWQSERASAPHALWDSFISLQMCLRFDICSSQREIIHIGFVSLCGRVGVRVNDEICRINKSVFPETLIRRQR